MTIGELYTASFPAALEAMRAGRSWASDELNHTNQIAVRRLDRNAITETISIPVTWTLGDVAKNSTDGDKASLVNSLIRNTIESAEDLILMKLRDNPMQRFIFSADVRYWISPVTMVPGQAAFYLLCCFVYQTERLFDA